MTLFAILPVKPLAAGKSRLAEILSDAERAALNRRLATHAIGVAAAALGGGRTMVISRDAEALDIARRSGAIALHERDDAGLNAALDRAREAAVRRGADQVLVLPVDLPLLEPADIATMIAAAGESPAVAIAPDHDEDGTNALLLAPPAVLPFAFGPGSFATHFEAARRAGIEPAVVRRKSLALDVDTPEDYALLQQAG